MGTYWLGVATPFMVAAMLWLAVATWNRLSTALSKRGWSIEYNSPSDEIEGPSEFALRNHIWFERQRGPFFSGYWYREPPKSIEPEPTATRWLGIGHRNGHSLVVFKKRPIKRTVTA